MVFQQEQVPSSPVFGPPQLPMMPGNNALSPDSALAADIFDHYCAAQTFKGILSHYRRLCATLNLKPGKFPVFYPKLKSKLKSWKAQGLFAKFDKRASHKCYNQGRACASTRVLVIGCGPCGLRAAIEAQLLGARVVLLEKRDRFSRNNVLHLWPMVIHDLKSLGAKKFFGKFCAGAIDHISIRQLQCILLKVALLLGVEVYENVGYEELVEPSDERTGWRARLSPPDHPAADFQFDVLVGADGKRNTFKCFRRKEFRGKLAIAITANFVNRHTEAEARVDEISGVAFIFNQKFFKDLYEHTGIELENIVYYKDETHYFVMTAKKQSLLAKGVIIQDFMDTNRLLSPENVNRQKLMQYAREAADFSTEHRLPQLPFALNHYGREDVAMFDFTCMYASQNAGKVMERHGHKLLLQLVGDSLLEPFWPTGSGCARGFLSCFDAAWQMRAWSNPRVTTLECLAERESIYRQLAQTTPRNLSCEYHGYTLDPRTRYPNLNRASVSPHQVRDLVDTDNPEALQRELTQVAAGEGDRAAERPPKKARREPLQADMLLKWCQKQLALTDIQVTDLTLSFKSGLALCGILHKYRPDLVDLSTLPADDPLANTQLAFSLVESELGVPPVMTAQEMTECACPDRLAMLSYLSQVYDALHGEIPYVKPKIAELLREETVDAGRRSTAGRPQPDGRRSSLSENARKQRKRKSDAAKDKGRVIQDLKKDLGAGGPTKKEEFATKIKDLEAKFKGNYVPPDKKPKDLSRAIGRIEKTDWNVREIEKKIEDSKRVHTSREPAQPVPMWSKDMFDDKYKAMRNLSEKGAVPPETLRKYADIDQHLRRLELKLREGTTRDVGQRGSNRVSQMAQQFLDRADRAPAADKKTEAGAAEACHFCNERVYLVERMSAEGRFFHHGCFRCEYCGTVLKMMNYAFDQDSGRFFCMPHFGLHSLVKYKYQRKPEQPSDTPDKGLTVPGGAAARGATPERAEFENSVLAVASEDRLSEMDEDEWTDHNFGMSAAELTSEDLLDGEDSEEDLSSSDSDAYEPALDEDEVLRLAERWRRRHSQDPLDEPSDLYESDGCDRDGEDSDTATQSETEDDASARLRRQQEVHLPEDVLKSRNRSSKHGDTSDTETSSDSDSSSSEDTTSSSEDEDATEVATDSEFDDAPAAATPRPLPTIVIENSAVGETTTSPEPGSPRPGERPEPIGAEQGDGDHAAPAAAAATPAGSSATAQSTTEGEDGGDGDGKPATAAATAAAVVGRASPAEVQAPKKTHASSPRRPDAASPEAKERTKAGAAGAAVRRKHPGRPRGTAEQAETIRNVNARPHGAAARKPTAAAAAEAKRAAKEAEEEEEDSVAKIIREAKKAPPSHRPYMIQRTESSEAIAWKSSLELKRKYLTEQTAPYAPCKSQSTTDLDNRVKTFMSRISETQKLLGARPPAAPAPRPTTGVRLTLDSRTPSLASRLAGTSTAAGATAAAATGATTAAGTTAAPPVSAAPPFSAASRLGSPLMRTVSASPAVPVTTPTPAAAPAASSATAPPAAAAVSSALSPAASPPPRVPSASPPASPPPVPEVPPPETSETGGSELDDAPPPASATAAVAVPAAATTSAVTPSTPPAISASSSASTSTSGSGSERQLPPAAAAAPPLPTAASQDSAGTEQAELEESLTDVSAVDSQSGEARTRGELAAIVESMHSSLSEGPDVPQSLPLDVVSAETVGEEEKTATAAFETAPSVVGAVVKSPDQSSADFKAPEPPPPAAELPSLDATTGDFDALLGGLDVTRLEQKFEGVCGEQTPPAALSPAPAPTPAPEKVKGKTDASGGGKREEPVPMPVCEESVAASAAAHDAATDAAPDAATATDAASSPAAAAISTPVTPAVEAPEAATTDDTISALPVSKAAALDVTRLIEENRTLLSQIRRRRSSGEPVSPSRRTAEPEPPPLPVTALTPAADSLESPGESAARDATELDLSDWAHESEVGSVADVPHEFRVDDRFVTTRRGAAPGGDRANLATLSDFEDDVSELPEDPVSAPPRETREETKGEEKEVEFDDLDFADNSASGEEGATDPPPSAKNRGRCEFVFPPESATTPLSPASEAKDVSKPATATAEAKPGNSTAPDSRTLTTPASSSKTASASEASSTSTTTVTSKPVTSATAAANSAITASVVRRPASTAAAAKDPVKRRSAAEALAESKSKYVKSSGYGKITAPPSRSSSVDSGGAGGSSLTRKPSTGKAPGSSSSQKTPKENGLPGRTSAPAARSRAPLVRGSADRTSMPLGGVTMRGSAAGRTQGAGRSARPLSAGPLMATASAQSPSEPASVVSAQKTTPTPAPRSAPAAQVAAAVRTPARSPAVPRTGRAAADIRVSPIVEQASARLLLQRSPTDSAIMLSQRSQAAAAAAAGMRPGAPAPRAQQGSLVRDLVLSRVKSPERQLRKRLSSPAFNPRVPPPPPPPTAPPPATPPTPRRTPPPQRRPSAGGALPGGPPPPKPPRDPTAALSLFTASPAEVRPGPLRGALSRSTPSVLERTGMGTGTATPATTPAGAASPDLSSSPSVSRSPERGGPEGRSDPASGGHDLSKRGHPRRRSIIRAISDIFKSGEKKEKGAGAACSPQTSPPARRRSSASPTRVPPQRQQSSAPAPAPFVKANSVRDKLGLKFRRGKERRSDGGPESPRTSGEHLPPDQAAALSPDASLSESLSMSQYSDAATPGGSLTRRAKTSRAARHAEMRRLQRAQELQRQVDEVEVRQRELERRGIAVEKAIRGEGQPSAGVDETSLMHEWFELVHERSLLVRRDQLLQLQLQELQLEDRHDRLQLELRDRMATSDAQKTSEDVERERQVVTALLDISEQRRSLRAAMDTEQERLASECETSESRRAAAGAGPLTCQPAEPAESTV